MGEFKNFFLNFSCVLEKKYVVGQSFGFMNILAQGKDTKGANLKTILKGIIVQMESREQGTGTVQAPLRSHLGLPGSCYMACKSLKVSLTSLPEMFRMFSPSSPPNTCPWELCCSVTLWQGFSCGQGPISQAPLFAVLSTSCSL